MARSKAELEVVREKNRAALGLAGLSECAPCTESASMAHAVPGGMGAINFMSLIPNVGIEFAFPPLSAEFSPGQERAPQAEGPAYGDWLLKHVFRPTITVGPARISPYEAETDFSGFAKVATVVGLGLGVLGTGWVLVRAFSGRRD